MQNNDIPKNQVWRIFFSNYFKLLPVWIILWFLIDAYLQFSSGLYGFAKGWLLVYWAALFLILNPFLAGIKTFIQKKKITGERGLKLLVPALTVFLLSAIILISPWIISPIHTQIYKETDQKTVASLEQLAKKEYRFNIQVTKYKNQENVFDGNWLSLWISLRINNFKGYHFYDIEKVLSQVDFKRDTEIQITITDSTDDDEYYIRYFYNTSTKKLSGL